MKSFTLSPALARSTSMMAVAACLLLPATAYAQSGAGIDAQGATATNAQPVGVGEAQAQQDTAGASSDEIVVTGVRASLNRAIDIKRNSAGVVDAISAEDIGKFPDTNLAESLQRITGVSINRVNGEGSQVSVRGFSGDFNLVTVNGRQLPASNVDVSGSNAFARGTGRSFDFQNLASEGVSTLEVYKTGRASIPSGGIGASINIVTRKPLDARETGLSGSIGGKALYDNSIEDAEGKKHRITPEVSGVLSWSNPDQTFGASVFGSYQLRHSASVNSNPNYWNVVPTADFFASGGTYLAPGAVVENRPTAPYVLIPNDSRYALSENRRERINAQAVLQFKPTDTLELSVDGLFAQNKLRERRSEQTNWFQRPFNRVTFDDNDQMATAIFLSEAKLADKGYEQQAFGIKNQLKSVGANGKWEFADNLTLTLDGHHSTSKSSPDNPNGTSSVLFSIGAPVRETQTLDFSTGFPQQAETINDCTPRGGNCNNQLDVADLGTQVARTATSRQSQRINEGRAQIGWDLGEGSRFDFGGNYIDTKMTSRVNQTTQLLGDWGISDTGLPNQLAGDLLDTFCLTCKFDHYKPNSSGSSLVAFRGDAIDLLNIFSPYYSERGKAPTNGTPLDDTVREKTWAAYGQLTWGGEIAGRNANAVIGVRYEQTRVKSTGVQGVSILRWAADNDFFVDDAGTSTAVSGRGRYSNLLPSLDFNMDLVRNVKARVSFSRTLARANYGQLFATGALEGGPPRPTALGGVAPANSQNPALKPLLSDNFDVSIEWYYKPSSFVSVGFFDKRVRNFIGTGVINRNLFGIRDASAGAPGSRSGTALERLRGSQIPLTDINLFTYTALLQENGGNVAATDAIFNQNFANGELNGQFVQDVLTRTDITPNDTDPLANFAVKQPLNNQDGKIHGFEFALTHFFGNTGFGFAGSYTKVSGNVNVDPYADPTVNIFALTGLGDSANATAIYDKNGLSARVSYNWRAKYLAATNQGANRNPLFVAPFGTLDANISYDVSENIAVSLEAINLTSEPVRQYARSKENLVFAQELKPRFLVGARYRF
ncbi:TonB-dependent receptor [uncultured Sphingomonas sp.]|uniref:TonB-dependent receptor n=1 Tax=uncultured Sphingomonas sp. TaxID=158754 RepID=UPI0025EA7BB0|nr:TonB-dependent receptor [uncultured Sphingomonas sp.]